MHQDPRSIDLPNVLDPHLSILVSADIALCEDALPETQNGTAIAGRTLWEQYHGALLLPPRIPERLVHVQRRDVPGRRESTRAKDHLPDRDLDVAQERRLR